jgi:hypothetical protein
MFQISIEKLVLTDYTGEHKKKKISATLTFVVNLDVTRDVVFLFKLTLLLTINPTIQNDKNFNSLSCLAHYFDC